MDKIQPIQSVYQPVVKEPVSPSTDVVETSKPAKNNNELVLASLAGLAVIAGAFVAGRKGHLGEGVQKFLKGSNKTNANNLNKAEQTAASTVANTNLSNSQKASSKLAEFYDGVASTAKAKGNIKREQIYSDFAQRAQNGEFKGQVLYGNLFDEYYNSLRKADYPIDSKFNNKISELTEKSTPKIEVRDENNWHYRLPKNRNQQGWSTADKCVDRVSVNALTDEKLVLALDDLFSSGKVKGYYKTPNDAASWLERHDPITIYLHEIASPQVLADIEKITKPYIRSTEDVLAGNKFAPGLALEKSPQIQEIQDVIDKAAKIDPDFADSLRLKLSKNGKLSASSGQMHSAQELLNLFN